MQKLQIEGIVVQSIPFKDYDRIVTLFTPREGLIRLVVKGALRSDKGKGYGMEPLAQVEVLYTQGRGDLCSCFESTVLNSNVALRSHLLLLRSACEMLQIVSATQQQGKPASDLYELLIAYLQRLPAAQEPRTIASSFRLKTLRHEGLFSLHFYCALCHSLLDGESFHYGNELFCKNHASKEAMVFSKEERDLLLILAFCRDFNILRDLPLSDTLLHKICCLFEHSIAC
jgi:DNA repair protein RecO (recombination protein O)